MACFPLGGIAEESLILQVLKPSEAEDFKDHFRIAHKIAFLFPVMADGNQAVSICGLPDILDREGHVAVHGQADSGIGAE